MSRKVHQPIVYTVMILAVLMYYGEASQNRNNNARQKEKSVIQWNYVGFVLPSKCLLYQSILHDFNAMMTAKQELPTSLALPGTLVSLVLPMFALFHFEKILQNYTREFQGPTDLAALRKSKKRSLLAGSILSIVYIVGLIIVYETPTTVAMFFALPLFFKGIMLSMLMQAFVALIYL